MRLRPFEVATTALRRAADELSRKLDKPVDFEVDGETSASIAASSSG
jgi:chemotaxis protein histidine kinase CheA